MFYFAFTNVCLGDLKKIYYKCPVENEQFLLFAISMPRAMDFPLSVRLSKKFKNIMTKVENRGHPCPMDTFLVVSIFGKHGRLFKYIKYRRPLVANCAKLFTK